MNNTVLLVKIGATVQTNVGGPPYFALITSLMDGRVPYLPPDTKMMYLAGFSDDDLTPLLSQLKSYNGIEIYNLNTYSSLPHFPKLSPYDVHPDFKVISLPPVPNGPVIRYDQPLFGDKVEQALQSVGVDKIAKVYERITKRPCNCKRRKELLNNIHRKIIKP